MIFLGDNESKGILGKLINFHEKTLEVGKPGFE